MVVLSLIHLAASQEAAGVAAFQAVTGAAVSPGGDWGGGGFPGGDWGGAVSPGGDWGGGGSQAVDWGGGW